MACKLRWSVFSEPCEVPLIISPLWGRRSNVASDRYVYPETELYGPKNSFRMRACHRLDVGATFTQPVRHSERIWRVGADNAYSRNNPYHLYYSLDAARQKQLYQLSLFPILPAISNERSC